MAPTTSRIFRALFLNCTLKPTPVQSHRDYDDWHSIFSKVMAADILVITTPIWLGDKSSVCPKVIERLYSTSGELNNKGQYAYYGRLSGYR